MWKSSRQILSRYLEERLSPLYTYRRNPKFECSIIKAIKLSTNKCKVTWGWGGWGGGSEVIGRICVRLEDLTSNHLVYYAPIHVFCQRGEVVGGGVAVLFQK